MTVDDQYLDGLDNRIDTGDIDVTVRAVADAPNVSAGGVQVTEDNLVGVPVDISLVDTDDSEAITDVTISGLPPGATVLWGGVSAIVNGGTYTLTGSGPGGATFTVADLDSLRDGTGLSIMPPAQSSDDFTLSVSATSSELNEPIAVPDATASAAVNVTVAPQADFDTSLTLIPTALSSDEGGSITLTVSGTFADVDGSESHACRSRFPGWTIVGTDSDWTQDPFDRRPGSDPSPTGSRA